MTSLLSTLTVKKSMKMTFSSDKILYIYYKFSQENPKITKIPWIDIIRTLIEGGPSLIGEIW